MDTTATSVAKVVGMHAVYYEDDERDPDYDWPEDPNYDYEEGYYEDEAYFQDHSPTAADSYVDET